MDLTQENLLQKMSDNIQANACGTPEKAAKKAAVRHGRSRALLWCLLHIVPVAVSFSILQLSFRTVYWQNMGASRQNEQLAAFQVVAKVHELLITLSLSYIVLYYVQQDLLSRTDSLSVCLRLHTVSRLAVNLCPTPLGKF